VGTVTSELTSEGRGEVSGAGPRWWNGAPAALLVAALFAGMAIAGARAKGPAYDETGHLTAGASYWLTGDHRLQPENGLLPQLLVGLPGWIAARGAAGAPGGAGAFPPRSGPEWEGSDVWRLGHRWLYESGLDWRALLRSARMLVAAVAAGLGLLVYAWSRRLFGPTGGLLSLLLFAFSPTLLAHGALATSDLCAAAAFLLALLALQGVLERVTVPRLAGAGAALTVLFLGKGSALLVLPIAAVLLALRLLSREPLPAGWIVARGAVSGGRRVALLLALPVVLAACVWAGLWAGYGFHYAVQPPGTPPPQTLYWGGWPHVDAAGTPPVRAVGWMRDHHVLPEPWLYGLGFVLAHSNARDAFLDGRYSPDGFPDFFLRAAVYKTTPAELALLLLAAAAALAALFRRRGAHGDAPLLSPARGAFRVAPLLLLVLVVGGAALGSHLNIGHRHLLPLYPAAFILAGAAASWLRRPPRWMAALVLLALAGQVVDSLAVRPDYLAYFSPLCSGPREGYRHLVDSSLDWGQDLPGLAAYLQRERASAAPPAEVYLSYFGTGSPDAEGIVAKHLPFVPDRIRHVESYPLGAGLYCVSATMLQNVYTPIKPPWSAAHEAEWQSARADVERLEAAQADPATFERVLAERGEAGWNSRLGDYEQLRFARLCALLRARTPDAEIGDSILVYRLTQDEATAAVYGPAPAG
jgi:hypothetical protein